MPCCSNKSPRVTLHRKAIFRAVPVWNDNNRCTGTLQRQIQWRFYRNGVLVYSTAFEAPTAGLDIGTGSTYLYLTATNAQITAFLIDQAIPVNAGDQLCVQVRIRNCQNEYATSNKVCFTAVPVVDDACACEFVLAFDSGQSGNTATPPVGYTAHGGELVFSNGLMNPEGTDFSGMPLVETDLLTWLTLDAECDGNLEVAEVTGVTGDVPIPVGFTALPATDYLVFRNGACQRTFAVSGSNLIPAVAPSEPSDNWHFVRLQDNADNCRLRRITINASGSGTAFNLPAGYSAANQGKWLLFVNELLQYPTVNYSVVGNQVTLVNPASEGQVWIVVID